MQSPTNFVFEGLVTEMRMRLPVVRHAVGLDEARRLLEESRHENILGTKRNRLTKRRLEYSHAQGALGDGGNDPDILASEIEKFEGFVKETKARLEGSN